MGNDPQHRKKGTGMTIQILAILLSCAFAISAASSSTNLSKTEKQRPSPSQNTKAELFGELPIDGCPKYFNKPSNPLNDEEKVLIILNRIRLGKVTVRIIEDLLREGEIDLADAKELIAALSDMVPRPPQGRGSVAAEKNLYIYLSGSCIPNGGAQCFDAGVLLQLDKNLNVAGHTQVGDERGIVFGNALTTDIKGNVYVVGETTSNTLPLIDAVQGRKGSTDGVILTFGPGGGPLVFSSYLGGVSIDRIRDVAVDRTGNIYVVGHTQSRNFPKTGGAFQRKLKGRSDAFVVKITPLSD